MAEISRQCSRNLENLQKHFREAAMPTAAAALDSDIFHVRALENKLATVEAVNAELLVALERLVSLIEADMLMAVDVDAALATIAKAKSASGGP